MRCAGEKKLWNSTQYKLRKMKGLRYKYRKG